MEHDVECETTKQKCKYMKKSNVFYSRLLQISLQLLQLCSVYS